MAHPTDRSENTPMPLIPTGRFDPATAWAVGGAITTFWGVVIAIILSLLTPVREWVNANHQWLVPTLAVFLVFAVFILGFMIAELISRNRIPKLATNDSVVTGATLHSNGVTDLASLWERERNADTVWVVSPELYYDILNPTCHEVVTANRARNVEYRYIVQNTQDTTKRIEEYQKVFDESDADIESQFLRLPASELSAFLTEIVIYDAETGKRAAYGYPPASLLANPDVIVFSDNITEMYIEKVQRIWLQHKVSPPTKPKKRKAKSTKAS